MRSLLTKILRLPVLLAVLAAAVPALADVLPPPERPADWDEHAPPAPAPPPEKEEIAALSVLLLSAVALAGVAARRRGARIAARGEQAA